MKKRHSGRVWFICPGESWTNKRICEGVDYDEARSMRCMDRDRNGQMFLTRLDLLEVSEEDAMRIRASKADLDFSIKIFVRDTPGSTIYRFIGDYPQKLKSLTKKQLKTRFGIAKIQGR